MRSRLVVIVAVLVAAAAVAFAIYRVATSLHPAPPAQHVVLPPHPASWLGVFERGAPPAYRPVSAFASVAGRQPNLVGYYSGWAEPFKASFARLISSRGIIPYVQIDPTDASVAAIAAGSYDDYLRSYADSVRDFSRSGPGLNGKGRQVVIGFGHEMNSPAYSWGYHHVPATVFVRAWRHLVTVFREEGAHNVTWLWTVQTTSPDTGPLRVWWPGKQYVNWVGIDGYYYRQTDTFKKVFGGTIGEVGQLTDQPILLSETAVGPAAGQFAKIPDLFTGISDYKILGLVWFDITQHGGILHQDWRIEGHTATEAIFKLTVSDELRQDMPRQR
jgi:mannan endo-1,4-beta-mannosidase